MPRNIKYSDETLKTGSDYLEYHVNMYMSTLYWLLADDEPSFERNAELESHLVNASVLIDFLRKDETHWPDDVLAVDFFLDSPNSYSVLNDHHPAC